MRELSVDPGESIRSAAERMVACARTEDCFVIFNGICVPATHGSTVESVCREYDRLCQIRSDEYAKSPEGIAAKQKSERERRELQSKADSLMAKLELMDFSDLDLCLRWLCEMEEPRDRIGVKVDTEKIRRVFIAHGFQPNAYCHEKFVKGDPEIEARWLIGQAIAEKYVPMVRHFYAKLAR